MLTYPFEIGGRAFICGKGTMKKTSLVRLDSYKAQNRAPWALLLAPWPGAAPRPLRGSVQPPLQQMRLSHCLGGE